VARRLHVARVTVDFSDVQEFEPLGKGEYPVVVSKVEFREPQTEDKYPYLNWELDVTDSENKGRKLWFITSLAPRALFRMKEVFENLGLPSDAVNIDYDEESMLVTEPELVGLPAIAVVSVRMYEGRSQDSVDTLLSSDTPARGAKKTAGKAPARGGRKTSTAKAAAKPAAKKTFR